MTDAKQQISYDVVYTLEEIETGYLLTVTADNTWIEDMERAYPVSIDPSMILYGGDYQGSITATCLTEGSNVTGAGGESLYVGHDSYGRDIQAFLQFGTLPTLPANCNVVSAVLGMYQHTYSAVGMNRLFLRAHEVNAATPPEYNSNAEWIRNMTWSTKPEFDEEDSEAYIRIGSGSNGAYQIWDISRIVSKWYENSASTRMLAIDAIGPEGFSSTKYAAGVFWMNVGYTPVFLVYYRNNVGIEGRYTYQTASAGKAGSTYVGDYTAQLTVANTLLSSNSEVLPFSLTAYYNSPYRGRYFSADNSFGMHTADYSTMKLGSGWKLSVQESVVNYTVTTGDEPIEYYVYTDEDGTEHYFEVTPNQSTYQDDEGLGLTLSVSGTLYTIQDESENKKEFTNGYLTKLLDRNGNAIYYLYNDNTAYNSSNKFNPSSTGWKPKANQANRITQIIQINDNGTAADLPVLVCRFQYDGEFLSRITDAGGRSYTFTYQTASSGARLLSEIGFPGDISAFYQYSSGTHLLSKLYDEESQNGVELAYQNRFNNYFVQSFKAFMASSVGGAQTLYNVWHSWSPTLQQRQYRFYGTDHESNTDDDIVTHYVFDIAGRTVNVIDHNTDRSKVLGASAASYTQNQGTQKTNNRLLGSASSGTSAVNLLQNNSMEIQPESSLEWSLDSGNTGGNGAFRSSVTEVSPSIQPRTGNYLLKMHAPFSMVSNTSEGGVVSEYQSVYLESGKTYVFSGYGNTRGMVSFGYNGGLTLSFQDNNGAVLAESDPLDYVTTATIESGWSRLQVSFTPETSGMYRVAANLKNAASYAAFDDFQLEEAPVDSDFMPEDKRAAASSYNLVQFGSLEKWDEFGADSSSAATYWTYDPSRASPIDSTDLDENRGYVMQIQGHPDAGRRAAQNIPVNRSSDTTYMLSAWGKAKSVTDCAQISEMEGDNSTYQRFFGMIAKLTYEDTSTPEYHYISFDPQYDGWQYTSGYIVPKRPGKVVKSIQISLAYDHNINTSWFDQISLTEEPAQTYTYDADGKLKTVTASGEMEDTYTYNGPDLTKFVSASSGTFDFEYDDNHNMTTATNDGLVLSAQYDEAGNNTSAKLQKGSAGAYMQSSATYTADGNHPLSVTDVDGLKTQYSYDSMGRVYTVQSPYEGGSISKTITYDSGAFSRSNGSFSSGTYALSDAFENGLLSRTARKTFSGSTPNWQKYEMTRDAGGNITRIQVQTARGADAETEADELWSSPIVLARYRYPLPNLPIEQTIFGNGDSENYLADDYYRVIGSQHWSNGELEYQEALSYDSNGNQAGSVVTDGDGIEIAEYSYEYDSLGRLIRSEQSGSSVGALRTQHQYDAQNRLCSQSWQLPGHEFWEVFTYNNQNGTMSSMEMGSGESVNYAYDSLLRLESVTLEDVYEHRRNYTDGDLSGQQTSQIQYFNYYDPDGTTLKYGYRYLYDNGGKIQEVYYRENNEPLALENTFEYDKLGQLTSATGAFGNETYTYDTAGNLLTRTSGATSAQYTYDNPSWGDLLTAYQGQRIAYEGQSYDAENNTVTGTVVSGNPVSYYNGNRWDMEWIRGRLLSQATSDDISVAYTYDKNNLRSSKTVNGVEYSYTYAGDKLMRQSWAGNELYFFYDASGNPTALWYEPENGSTVVGYYMLDQQGDVVRMEDANGNVLASYSYDPWGKIISATGSLAEINPLRYRGYVYDQETGFYYLQSRYYDPAISRFLNADGYAVTGEGDVLGYNMFAYCNNDPVNKSDTDGSRPVEVDEDPNRRLVATLRSELRGDTTSIDTKNPPPEGSGYQPPKKGLNKSHNRGKVRNPNGQGQGWPDKDGNAWVPDNGMDGGPGWVVQHPDGGHHHVYPDGKTRYHSSQMVINWGPVIGSILIGGTVVGISYVVINDVTLVGILDDAILLPPLYAAFEYGTKLVF